MGAQQSSSLMLYFNYFSRIETNARTTRAITRDKQNLKHTAYLRVKTDFTQPSSIHLISLFFTRFHRISRKSRNRSECLDSPEETPEWAAQKFNDFLRKGLKVQKLCATVFTMLRLIMTATISLLISFGAISKSQKVSNLLNHVTQDHAPHSHDNHIKHHHHHSHKHSKNKKSSENKHSHQFDLSLLAQFFTFESYQVDTVVIPSSIGEELLPISHTSLVLGRYSISIFRPPIV